MKFEEYTPNVLSFRYLINQALVRAALNEAFPNHPNPSNEIAAICFTKGPGMVRIDRQRI